MTATPAVAGWFTTGEEPALLGTRCTTCATVFFPPATTDEAAAWWCRRPTCDGSGRESVELSRRGRVWSYTDARYQPPPPYVVAAEPYEPFALAAVELPEGMVVLGQLADGFGVDDVSVGSEVELVVEPLYADELGQRTIWRWRPVATPATGEPAEGAR